MATVSRAAVTRKATLTAISLRVDAAIERFEDSSRVCSVEESDQRLGLLYSQDQSICA